MTLKHQLKKIVLTTTFATVFLSQVTSFAGTMSNTAYNQHQGFYLAALAGTSGAYAKDNNKSDKGFWGFGIEGSLGYLFSPYWGVEAGASYMPNFWDGVFDTSDDLYIGYVALKGRWLLGSRFDLYGKLGGAYFTQRSCVSTIGSETCSSSNKFAPYLGVGAEYFVSKNFALQAGVSGVVLPSNNGIRAAGVFGVGAAVYFD